MELLYGTSLRALSPLREHLSPLLEFWLVTRVTVQRVPAEADERGGRRALAALDGW